MKQRAFEIVKLLSDLGAKPEKRGAMFGPDALLQFDHLHQNFFTGAPEHTVEQKASREQYNQLIANAKYIDAIYRHLSDASEKIYELLNFNKFPFVLSGDHSNGAATIAGLRAAYPHESIGVIWIDAHADIHTPYTTPSGNLHGMPVAMSLAEDNKENSSEDHDLTGDGLYYWEALKNLGVWGKGNISCDQLMFIDLRDTEKEEDEYIRRNNIKLTTPDIRKEKGIEFIVNEAISFASKFDKIYVSFDIDSMDKSLVPGTGTPVLDGLSREEAGLLLNQLWKLKNLSAFEITEINPVIEKSKTLESVYEVLSLMFKN